MYPLKAPPRFSQSFVPPLWQDPFIPQTGGNTVRDIG
jgi:hypothetical protein